VASTGIRRSRLRSGVSVTGVAGIVVAVVAGCATLPSENAPRQVLTGPNAVQAYVRPLPPPPPNPHLYTKPAQTVLGFLSASASYAYDPGAAMQFLSPDLRKHWHPGPVTVVSSLGPQNTKLFPADIAPTCRGRESSCAHPSPDGPAAALHDQTVDIHVQRLATLSQGGQYEYSPGGTSTYPFRLAKFNGVWLITQLPQGGSSLLLTEASFQEVYQPRNLFFYAEDSPVVNGELVPDPVYAPVQSADSAVNTDVAAGLVKGLLSDPGGWLGNATTTRFPHGTALLKVSLRGQVAVVNLGGAAEKANWQQKHGMYAQLRATLESKAYSSPLARNVVMEINGRAQYQSGNPNFVGQVALGPMVYQSGPGVVSQLHPGSDIAGTGQTQITALAATASDAAAVPAVAIAVPDRGGCAVDIQLPPPAGAQSGPFHTYKISASGGPCTSLSWDRNGNLWAVAGGHVFMLPTQQRKPVAIDVSSPANLPSGGSSGSSILSLQMAPDGVRAALLVETAGKNRVMLAAVTQQGNVVSLQTAVPAWTGLRAPIALSWYNAYYLVVLAKGGIWQVPLTGGAGRLLGSAPARAVSLTTDGVTLVVGTASTTQEPGKVYISSTLGSSWQKSVIGSIPAYADIGA
jgi:hypothetical protein